MKPPDPAAARLVVNPHIQRVADTPEPPPPAPDPLSIDDVEALLADIGFAVAGAMPEEEQTTSIFDAPGLDIPERDDMLAAKFEEAADPQRDRWLRDPIAWVNERLNGYLWSKQCDIVTSLVAHPKTAVRTCHNIGKSYTAALVACWWIDVHPPGTAFVITTAPTGAQVKAILWRYINRMHAQHQLPGRMNLVEWYVGNELVALGRKPSDYTEDAFQGIHAEYVLAIIDEACGVEQGLWDDISTMTSNVGSRTLAIGNPDDPNSYFQQVCEPGSGWNVIGVSAFETPNLTGEEVPDEISRSLISKAWIEDRKIAWGVDSPIYISKVLGEFPVDSEDGVVPASFVMPCKNLADEKSMSEEPVALGVDVGDTTDRTVVVVRRGQRASEVHILNHGSDAMNAVGQIVGHINKTKAESVVIDVVGLGWGVYSRLKELSRHHNPTSPETTHSARIVRFSAAETAHDPVLFYNKRAELWWNIGREYSRTLKWDLSKMSDDVIAELTTPRYSVEGSKSRIVVESKKDIRKRIGRSPDIADALLMAFYEGEPPPPPARFPESNRQLAQLSLLDDTSVAMGIMGPR